ncbi:50S rRNA methyltransferase [Syntrophotalea acetylenivorans]|uniref:Ribosomal RNA large subunit methyltransferase H n=1 Tax=Syntrophotalea acetylenivorans TaxID=1842532 RepID=A0A1L3GPI3_9BACT|nr:23S rRNA (pseudouridine(1915)-N(3))-methyltransferase RlmH [Syntrophotalea acetylenivorans]APG27790.1 50S rRNA methyltransferase [Syntrophotalea acetylenivorans]
MKIGLISVGKLSQAFLRDGVAEYAGRLQRYISYNSHELKESKGGSKPDPKVIREQEGERILARVPDGAYLVVLDERGRNYGSEELAEFLGRHMLQGTGELVFAIGGAYGLSRAVKERANLQLSLSAMTLTHQMARLLLLEQLYRGFTILRNEPYHNR